jgi:hypothetical protein
MQAERRTVERDSWPRWMLANLIGFTIGGAIGGAVLRARLQPYFEVMPSGVDAARILAVSTGLTIWSALIGTAQWVALRRSLRAGWWLPATCLGWALSGIVLGALSGVTGGWDTVVGPDVGLLGVVVAAVAGCILIGLVPSTLQWLVLRRQVDRAGWWPLASLGGFAVGFGGGFAVVRWGMVNVVAWLRPEDFPSAKALVLVGAVTGILYGVVTWPVLARLLRRAAAATDPTGTAP